jgi:hypothetical protein
MVLKQFLVDLSDVKKTKQVCLDTFSGQLLNKPTKINLLNPHRCFLIIRLNGILFNPIRLLRGRHLLNTGCYAPYEGYLLATVFILSSNCLVLCNQNLASL